MVEQKHSPEESDSRVSGESPGRMEREMEPVLETKELVIQRKFEGMFDKMDNRDNEPKWWERLIIAAIIFYAIIMLLAMFEGIGVTP